MWQPEVTIPTLVCSTLSCAATSVVLILCVLSTDESKRRSLRYALVINLTVAEFINSFNNSVSGAWVLINRSTIPNGTSCDLNGWLGQVSVQAADFTILAISVVTFMILGFNRWINGRSSLQILALCLGVWVIPLITGTTALASGKINFVTGNWCWIARDPPWLRYALGHAWRYCIFIVVIALYSVIFKRVRDRVRARNTSQEQGFTFCDIGPQSSSVAVNTLRHAHDELLRGSQPTTNELLSEDEENLIKRPMISLTRSTSYNDEETAATKQRLSLRPRLRVMPNSKVDQETWRWFLMSMFPLTYIIVWLPGLANRMAELTGHSYPWLSALQATTQLTGFVNALVYGLREHRAFLRMLQDRYDGQY